MHARRHEWNHLLGSIINHLFIKNKRCNTHTLFCFRLSTVIEHSNKKHLITRNSHIPTLFCLRLYTVIGNSNKKDTLFRVSMSLIFSWVLIDAVFRLNKRFNTYIFYVFTQLPTLQLY